MLVGVMNLAYAEPDKTWGQRPCEGLEPSSHTCVSGTGVAARRTHPGLGAACKGSNAADRYPLSYGGQFRPELRSSKHVQERRSEPAAASQETFEVAAPFFRHCDPVSPLESPHRVLGVKLVLFAGSGGDPFTAHGYNHGKN